jgi:hypothetical protein
VRPVAVHALRASFTSGLDHVFLVGAILSLAIAILTFFLIRTKDFEVGAARAGRGQGTGVPAAPAEAVPAEPAT